MHFRHRKRQGYIAFIVVAMAARIRNADWEDNLALKSDLQKYVRQNLQRNEILDLVKQKYPMYAWSLRTLCRRLRRFDATFIDYDIDVADVKQAVEKEMEGPWRLLGYRAMHKKVHEVHGLNVARCLVYNVMADVNPEGLEGRGGVGQPKRRTRNAAFSSNVSTPWEEPAVQHWKGRLYICCQRNSKINKNLVAIYCLLPAWMYLANY